MARCTASLSPVQIDDADVLAVRHLKETESADSEDARMCIICQSPFEIGVLTECGHKFCKDCLSKCKMEHIASDTET